MNNIHNRNVINQYKNQHLYNNEIFEFILSKADINELKENQYEMGYHNNYQTKGNFEAFLMNGVQYNEPLKIEMNNKVQNKWRNHLLKPLYFIKLTEKEYILGQPGYEIFKNVHEYLRNLVEGKIEKLSDTEEKFVIDWFFKETPNIYLGDNNKEEINMLYEIFFNQKEYVNKKNEKSAVNNFFAHHGIKKIIALFSEEQKNNLMDKEIGLEEIIKTYYPKLLRQKHFDLADQLKPFDNDDIIKCLKENVSEDSIQWFKPFLEKGSGITLSYMDSKINLKGRTFYDKEKTKITNASYGAIKLLKKLHTHFDCQNIIKLTVCMIVECQNESLYKELRSFVELPKEETFQKYCSQAKLRQKSIEYIEKEVLKDKLEEKFDSKHKGKTNKI